MQRSIYGTNANWIVSHMLLVICELSLRGLTGHQHMAFHNLILFILMVFYSIGHDVVMSLNLTYGESQASILGSDGDKQYVGTCISFIKRVYVILVSNLIYDIGTARGCKNIATQVVISINIGIGGVIKVVAKTSHFNYCLRLHF